MIIINIMIQIYYKHNEFNYFVIKNINEYGDIELSIYDEGV